MGQKRDIGDLGDLDLQENERDEPEGKRLKVAVRDCLKCGECKLLHEYSVNRKAADGLQSYCKACARDYNEAYRNTQAGFLKTLVSRARNNTKRRNKTGRKHKFTLTIPKLKKLITDQDGKCAISDAVLVFKSFSDNQASVDRINDDFGYVDGNCRLVCLEFNTPIKWSRKLLVKSIALSGIPPKNFHNEISDLEEVLPKGNSNGTVYKKWKVVTKDGIETVFCYHCLETKPREDFYQKISSGCKACKLHLHQRGISRWRGALKHLIDSAKSSTKERNKHRSEDNQTKCTLTHLELVGILKAQGGMCAYSRVAMSPEMGDWKVSLERKDVRLGYSASNVCLVCQRFNGMDSSTKAEGHVEGSGGWSREKFLRYAALVSA